MKIGGCQITGCSRLRPAADAGHYVLAGNSVALLQPAFANFDFTKQSLTQDCSQPEAVCESTFRRACTALLTFPAYFRQNASTAFIRRRFSVVT